MNKPAIALYAALLASALPTASEANSLYYPTANMNQRLKAQENTPVNDFLVQDVCVDAHDRPIAGDPAVCAKHRNIRAGELLPYVRTDFGPKGARYQAVTSYPVVGRDGQLKVMVSKSMRANAGQFTNFQFGYQHLRDGFDLIETSGGLISAIRTSDGGCGDQIISKNAWQREDGWVLFPSNQNQPSGNMNHTIRMVRTNPPAACHQANNYNYVSEDTDAHTQVAWDVAPFKYRYESGKTLSSIDSYHVAHYDLTRTDNAIEKFLFTKEYGFTRWEAWIPRDRCYQEGKWFCNDPDLNLRGRCTGGGVTSWGGQLWVRVDCRDTTGYLAVAPFLPLSTSMAESDIDAANALAMGQAVAAIPGLYQNILGREPDAAGLAAHHHSVVLNGQNFAAMRAAFAASPEAREKVRAIFLAILDVKATDAQIDWETSRMGTGETSIPQIRTWFTNNHPRSGRVLVKESYKAALGTEISSANLNAYASDLIAGKKTVQAIRAELKALAAAKPRCEITLPACPLRSHLKAGTLVDNYDNSGQKQDRCLARAQEYASYCGTGEPVTAKFYSGGKVAAQRVSSVCQITLADCPAYPRTPLGKFYDNYGGSSVNQGRCVARAQEYKSWCKAKGQVSSAFIADGKLKEQRTVK